MHRVTALTAWRAWGQALGRRRLRRRLPNELTAQAPATIPIEQLPTVSIITPSYNQGGFLEQCIASVHQERYPKLEHIVIDGGSTDQTIGVIKRHEAHLSFWVSEPDAGQSDALNKGFRRATGNLVAWLNADDYYLPGALAAAAAAYCAHPSASFYFGDGLRVDASGKPISGFSPGGHVVFNRTALILGLNFICQPATFINRQHLQTVNYLDATLRYGLDTDLWIRLSAIAPPVAIALQLAASREYAATKTSTGSFQRIEELRQIAERYSNLPMTPGVLCYFLDTLHHLVQQHADVYPPAFRREVEAFWTASARLMAKFGAGLDGFPTGPDRPQD